MANVCIGPGLGVDSQGRLTLDMPPWHLPACDPGDGPYAEPVGVDDQGRLWAPPRPVVWSELWWDLAGLEYVAPGAGVNAGSFSREFGVLLANPDPCRRLTGVLIINVDARFDLNPASQVFVEATVVAPDEGPGGDDGWTMRNDSSATRRLYNEFVRTATVSIGPGGIQSLRWSVASGLRQGSGVVRSVSNTVRVMAVSSDPT